MKQFEEHLHPVKVDGRWYMADDSIPPKLIMTPDNVHPDMTADEVAVVWYFYVQTLEHNRTKQDILSRHGKQTWWSVAQDRASDYVSCKECGSKVPFPCSIYLEAEKM